MGASEVPIAGMKGTDRHEAKCHVTKGLQKSQWRGRMDGREGYLPISISSPVFHFPYPLHPLVLIATPRFSIHQARQSPTVITLLTRPGR